MESESLINNGLEIPRDYYMEREDLWFEKEIEI